MLDTKKYQDLLEGGRKKAAQLEKRNAPLVKAVDDAQRVVDDLASQIRALQKRLSDFEAGEVVMTDDEFMTARARVDLLKIKRQRAGEALGVAVDALKAAENTARGELGELRNVALNAWRTDHFEADQEYRRAWAAL